MAEKVEIKELYEVELIRELGLIEAVTIGIGGMIGGGIFTVIGLVVGIAGKFVLLSLVLCTFSALLTGYSYSALAEKYPSSGASYAYVKAGFGEFVGGFIAWLIWFSYIASCSLYAVSFGQYMTYFVKSSWKIWSLVLIAVLTILNLKGAKKTGSVENILVAAKVVLLLLFAGAGFLFAAKYGLIQKLQDYVPNPTEADFRFLNIVLGSGLIFIAYEGFELIATSAEELKNPRKNIKRAIYICIVVVSTVYLLVTLIALMVIDPAKLMSSEAPLAEAAEQFLGSIGGILLGVGGLLATSSAFNASLFGSSRMMFALARDGLAPKKLVKLSEEARVPYINILFTSFVITILTLVGVLQEVATLSSLFFLITFFMVNLSAFRLSMEKTINSHALFSMIALIIIFVIAILVMLYLYTPLILTTSAVAVLSSFSITFYMTKRKV
ncbi:MAG: APC family permease [Candidatus Baldrarchaeia archaeon]